MTGFMDRYETRSQQAREAALFCDLKGIVSVARARAPALRNQLRGIDLASIRKRADLAAIPVVRRSSLHDLQQEAPPFGGLVASRIGSLRHVFMSPGPVFQPEGNAKDWWGSARAMYAAGFRKGDVVLNSFTYHLAPAGHMMENGAHALGCAVLPAGNTPVEQQAAAMQHVRPHAYCGPAGFLGVLLDYNAQSNGAAASITHALVTGAPLSASLRSQIERHGPVVRQCYCGPETGVVAYETSLEDGSLNDGLIVNEGLIVEIVRPHDDSPASPGEIGEVVVTRLNSDYPLLRFGTGDLSAIIAGASPCGRTNMRLRGVLGRVDQGAKVKGLFVLPHHVAEIVRQHPRLGRARLVVSHAGEREIMTLYAEGPKDDVDLMSSVQSMLRSVTNLPGDVRIVAPGSLPDDGKIIADERKSDSR